MGGDAIGGVEQFTPPSLVGSPKAVTFLLAIPTPAERDAIGARLFALGVAPVSQEIVRATLIDELYTIYDEQEADGRAAFLDDFWQRQAAQEFELDDWIESERRRRFAEMDGAAKTPQLPRPEKKIRIRDAARAKLIVDETLNRSQHLRALAARQATYPLEYRAMLARIHLRAATNGCDPLELTREGDLLTESSLELIRTTVGERAWRDLLDKIESLYEQPSIRASGPMADPAERRPRRASKKSGSLRPPTVYAPPEGFA